MTRCVEWYDKFEKDGDFCHLSPAGISSVKAYNELRTKIAKHIPDKAFVVDNFPEGAARPLIHCKDDETRIKGLNYVIECLNRKEKVTAGDLQTTINGWLKPNSCTVVKKESNPGHVSKNFTNVKSPSEQKPILPVERPKETIAPLHPSLAKVMAAKQEPEERTSPPVPEPVVEPPPRPPTPAPCTQLKPCPDLNYHCKTEKIRGRVCDVIGIPINQLPGNPGECPLEKRERLKGTQPEPFHPASEDGLGNKFVKPAPLKITAVPVSKEQASSWLTAIVRGYLSPKSQEIWEDIRKTGELGDGDLEIFQGLIDGAGERLGA